MPGGPHGGLCNAPGTNGNSDFHFLQASSFLQELIDSNRKRGSAGVKSQGGHLGPPPPPPPPPPPSSGNRDAYGMEDGRQRLMPPTPNNAQQPSPQDNPNMGGQPDHQQNWNFMGQKMWPSDKNCQVEDDFRLEYMVEYMELDEFLTENDIPLESVLQDQPPQIDQHPTSEDNGKTSSTGNSSASTQQPQQPAHPQPSPAANVTQPHHQNPPTQPPKMGPPPMATSPPINPQTSASGGANNGQQHMDGNTIIKSECVGGHASGPQAPPPQSHDYGEYGGGGGGPLPPMNGAQLCGAGGGGGDKSGVSLPPPPPPPPFDSSAVASNLLRKRKKQMVSEERKDEKYWERRRKNNMAAKRSRDARRAKETQVAIQATLLERENKNLTQELSKARAENLLLRERLQKYEPV